MIYRVTISNTYMDVYFEFTSITEAETFARMAIMAGRKDGKEASVSATIRVLKEEEEEE